MTLPGLYEHPSPSATGAHHTSTAQVWLADRVCRWVCDCECHQGGQIALF